ncbi:glycerophosphodiester phosphodiesterase, partial [Streptococcus moroccensis]
LTGLGVFIAFLLSLLFGFIDDFWDNLALQTLFYSLVRGLLYLITFLNKLVLIEVLVNHLLKYDEEHPDVQYVTLGESDAKPFRYPKWSKGILWVTVIVGVIFNGSRLYLIAANPNVLMIAHRGDVARGVENSIEALEGAAESGADLVEMDVVMTADNELVVIHDDDLGRLAGVDWQVTEKTLEELEDLEISQDRFTSKIVSFETYYKKAKELNQPLLIELKLYGTEPDNYVDIILEKLQSVGLRETDKVMSLDLDIMEKIEQKAPEIVTGYVIPLQFGDLSGFNTDFYVLEDTSYSDFTMWDAERRGKDIYVWTVNDEEIMANYLQSPVNGIITDELALFKTEQANLKSDDGYFARALRLLALQK